MFALWLVPLLAMASPDASPAPGAKTPLHEIARVKALTPYCAAFQRHFNGAARPMLAADANVGFLGYTLGSIEPHFRARGGELALYDDRVHMMAYVAALQKFVPQAQAEIDALRASAKLATDPTDAADTTAAASELQAALDKQRQLSIDSLGVVQALTDYTTSTTRLNFEDLGATLGGGNPYRAVALLARPDPMGYLPGEDNESLRASTNLQSAVPGGYDDYSMRTPAERRDVRSYLHWQNQLDRIGDAEGSAIVKADAIADRCR